MEKFIINGSNTLSGDIVVNGAKNSALKIIASTLLSDEPCRISNVPDIADIRAIVDILKDLGAHVNKIDGHTYEISCAEVKEPALKPELVRKLRASVVLLGPLLARFGEVKFPHPGGCVIGQRPIDIFIEGFKVLGTEVIEEADFYHFKAKKLTGATFVFPRISVTATESLILAASLAEGTTTLKFSACEPEIGFMTDYLNARGAKIQGGGTHTITIEGVQSIRGGDTRIIPDRIETGTFAILGALVGQELTIKNCNPKHLEVPWKIFRQLGMKFEIMENEVKVYGSKKLKATNLITHEYPGFITDLQAPFTVLMTQAEGLSLIHETIYDGRLFYIDKLNKMGAKIIMCDPHRAVVLGPTKLFGKKLESPDIRAGIALVISALIAEGESEIENIYQIDRGYEQIDQRLQALGADIKRVN
ncbi:UDP-N-acetylglucosamine 1-carboxyvinyltransferase [Patescibacteria group bacterium]|nr:UDP-N-acetylglucosamine 1-carboxyvinyltransferase [Patescibacteria group bacterium]MBU1890116.1 UDP-N-acetylglucosamine 1-carboxyvinyltransferase [Patescibacteria group bacterium]